MDFSSGGKKVIERLVEAYGFTTRQALCDHLGVSKSTMATRYMRDIFPADWVIQCVLETQCALSWLCYGKGSKFEHQTHASVIIDKKVITGGELKNDGDISFDLSLINNDPNNLFFLHDVDKDYIFDRKFSLINDGTWLIAIDGNHTVRKLTKLPNNRLIVQSGSSSFECAESEINIIAKAIKCITNGLEFN